MYYKIKHDVDFTQEDDFLDRILTSNGVENVEEFLHVRYAHTHDPNLFTNMHKATALLHTVLEKSNPHIYVQIDSDVDGYTSGCLFMRGVKDIAPTAQFTYKISLDKQHGLRSEHLIDVSNIDLIVIPDASFDSTEDATKIKEMTDAPILILDHHNFLASDLDPFAVWVNCTDGQYPNPTLSGVGVVYKFLCAYCNQYGLSSTKFEKYLDLVALGMIADSTDLRNLETRYYVLQGLNMEDQHNALISAFASKFESEFKLGHTIKSYGWTIAPNINAMVRYGSMDEQRDTIRAILEEEESIEYQPRRKNKNDPKPPIERHSLQETMVRICCNCKGRQDSEVRRYVAKLKEKIDTMKLDDNSVIVLDGTDIIKKNTVTGLMANRLASAYKRPVLLMREHTKDSFGGSGRAYGKGELQDFRQFLENTGLFEKCAGHEGAFGITLRKENVQKVIDICNEQIDKNDLVDVYEVDYQIPANRLTNHDVQKVANAYWIWGGKVDEPRFVITDLVIQAKDIMGFSSNGDYVGFIKFKYNGVDFVKKYCAASDYDKMVLYDRNAFGVNKKTLRMTIVGTFELNEYEGERYPQVVIHAFESKVSTQNVVTATAATSRTIDDDDLVF